MPDKKRIVFITSGGGHLDQALCLVPGFKDCDILVATYAQDMTNTIEETLPGIRVRRITYLSKKINAMLACQLCINFFQFLAILVSFRPHVIISTGSEIACPAFFAALLFSRAQRIHIETVERVATLSLTGKVMRMLAQRIFVQWPKLIPMAGLKSIYMGRIC
ncbi:MAG: hypothetical protein A2268_02135 [Candidatus Raymondbacteria bacterium RifOxyA12_full_50_37]|uniref:Polysaccharide biosynthesis protein n=1 Tax=Candidatus Raymondbacteria bacterium RIFOXYD12_FULL_49_13 TaxID=1817890 RepID=A0A1F7F4T1_UNCRA|nr:MAG: hypothetical protein A2268_02135 [Candidatus Raymondbacteria bacterium RifOxyA12_full_50_37]OGJ91292.1 MAG: hypothetical protein A2350_13200 [Candidatus Raymondbacteria bacterium RifOxyB12_full_50_8]OGJ92227.1 MAG: hypothetical protein A2248_10965 [Candidatus Raymondbacteria bacterium RIFOXYA2_FULL_49_16]OGJ98553.1 MAG: hypothetical protein A2453_06765 [Candidatus Raymondbacteria bacterium RIFOXYC2_FULL_50_21]OGK01588.1 MAG: hypothetical protein A2519_05965 [Candidatus Raymondbacteria b